MLVIELPWGKAPSTRWHEWAKLFAGLESASDTIELLTKNSK